MPLTISVRSSGSRRPLFADFEVPPPRGLRDDGDLTVRQVIEHVVREQVSAFRRRREAMRLDRVLTEQQIETGAARGKVDPAAKEHAPPAVDDDEAVAAAIQAFEDGLYLVIIDEVERRTLDEPAYLAPTSRLVFVRLAFLSGI